MQQLKGRAAWITGAASGIGLAVAHRLAEEGVNLALVDRDERALAATAERLREKGVKVVTARADVSSGDEVRAAAERAREALGVLHIIFNNAGIGGAVGPSWMLSEEDWRRVLDVNLWGVIHGTRVLLPPLLDSGEEGHVINTASMAGLTSPPAMAPYVASKHAVVAMSECLAKELELVSTKVSVSVLCPGFVKTNIATPSTAERPADHPMGAKLAAAMVHLVGSGVPADAIAERVVDAIRGNKFYVLTHPEMKPAIGHRMKQILNEEQPGIDPMMRAALS